MEGDLAVALPPKLSRAPLHLSVQQSLKQYVAENGLRGGDRLPPEATLARALGVARNSVREAVKALESVGILQVRRGVGVFVCDFSLEPLLDHLSFGLDLGDAADILLVLRTLEGGLLARVVAVIGAGDLDALAQIVRSIEARTAAGQSLAAEGRAFHARLFRCLDNRVLLSLIDGFWLAFGKAMESFGVSVSDPLAGEGSHGAILAAICAGEPAEACARLDRHYDDIAERFARRASAAAAARDRP